MRRDKLRYCDELQRRHARHGTRCAWRSDPYPRGDAYLNDRSHSRHTLTHVFKRSTEVSRFIPQNHPNRLAPLTTYGGSGNGQNPLFLLREARDELPIYHA